MLNAFREKCHFPLWGCDAYTEYSEIQWVTADRDTEAAKHWYFIISYLPLLPVRIFILRIKRRNANPHSESHFFVEVNFSLRSGVMCLIYEPRQNDYLSTWDHRCCKTVAHQTQLKNHQNWLYTACFYYNDTWCEVWDSSIFANKIAM